MACGTPVVATDVNGTAEVVGSPSAGLLMPERTVASLVATLARLRGDMPSRAETRRFAEEFDWMRIGRANKALLSGAASAGYRRRHAPEIVADARRNLNAV
jgi:glycosyltransferase involved in cell wall biosynthesis